MTSRRSSIRLDLAAGASHPGKRPHVEQLRTSWSNKRNNIITKKMLSISSLITNVLLVVCGYAAQLQSHPMDPSLQIPPVPSDQDLSELGNMAPGGPVTDEWETNEIELGQVAGIASDSKGNIHVFHRGSRVWDESSFDGNGKFLLKSEGPIKEDVHIIIDRNTGEIIHRGGAGKFYMPHGLFIDHEDNVWLTDVALHQVFKISDETHEPALVLGKAFSNGNGTDQFCQPTDVAVSINGMIFVSDGYCNSRVMMFDSEGTFETSFGRPSPAPKSAGYEPPASTFQIPHSLTLIEDWNLLCVADRENERVQCFSAGLRPKDQEANELWRGLPTGTFIKMANNLGRVFAIRNSGHFLVGVTKMAEQNGEQSELFVVDLENGDSNTYQVGLQNPHCLTVTQDESIYVGEIGPNKVIKVNL